MTIGEELHILEEKYKRGEGVIKLGTTCYKTGGSFEQPDIVVVTEENQKEISMFWNRLYFETFEEAKYDTYSKHASYGSFLFDHIY